MKFTDERTNFSAGELDPLMAGRSDTAFFQNGAARLLNWRPRATGGVQTRPGLRLVRELTLAGGGGSPVVPRVIPFVFRDDQTYLLAFADGWLEIFDPGGERLQLTTGMPWTLDRLDALTWAQSGDTMIVCQHTMRQQVIRRVAADEFTISGFTYEDATDGTKRFQPYYRYEAPAVTLAASATSGTVTLTTNADVFVAGHDNAIVRYRGREVLITNVNGPRSVTGTVRETLPSTAATTDWDEQAFSQARQYPAAVMFFENRLWFGGPKQAPAAFWASKSNAYFNFQVGTNDDDAIAERISHPTKMPRIRYFVGGKQLIIGTDSGGYYIPSSDTKPITPSSIVPRLQTSFGWGRAQPRVFDGGLLYIQAGGRAVRDFVWDDQRAQYTSPSVSLLASHLIRDPVDLDVVDASGWGPEQYAFVVMSDGTMAVLHSIRDEQVLAWVPWVTDGQFRRVCVVEGSVFVVVERKRRNELVVCTLERFERGLLVDEAVTVDRSGDLPNDETYTFDDLGSFAELTVEGIIGEMPIGAITVSESGSVTVTDPPAPAPSLTIGRRIETLLQTLPPDLRDRGGNPIRGRTMSCSRVVATFNRSHACRVAGQDVRLKFAGDTGVRPRVTGDREVRPLGWDGAQVTVETPMPADVTLLALTLDVTVGG